MEIDDYAWIFMDINVFPWISMESHGYPLIDVLLATLEPHWSNTHAWPAVHTPYPRLAINRTTRASGTPPPPAIEKVGI